MIQRFEVESKALWQRRLAAAYDERAQEQYALVDQSVPERPSPELDASLSRRTASGSNRLSILVLAVDTARPEPILVPIIQGWGDELALFRG